MLKVTIHSRPEEVRIQLEGRLTGPWVNELERCWHDAARLAGQRPIVLDLTEVDFVEESGKRLLAGLHRDGARFVANTPFMSDIVAEVTAPTFHGKVGSLMLAFLLLTSYGAATAAAQAELPPRTPLALSMKRAVELAISPEGNARLQISGEGVKQAQARSAQARAALLPDLEASLVEQNQTRNLAALGIRFRSPIPGFEFPSFVGPYNVFDARATATQNIFDFSSVRRYQASKAGVHSARSDRESTEDQVRARVAKAYLAVLRARAQADAVRANIQLAQAVFDQAQDLKEAGTGTGIEITRARVQLANEQQRLLVAVNEQRRAQYQLLREIGLRLDTDVELTDSLTYIPVTAETLEAARTEALKSRSDWQAQKDRESQARLSSSAVALERLPSIAGFADYGSIGTGITSALPTRTFGVSVRVPVFDGGRRDARRAESASQYRQEQTRTRDLRDQIELELRVSMDALASADEQVKVANGGLELAENEFNQARRRVQAGVASSLEVTDAQTRLERARDNQIEALFQHNIARIDLAQAQGVMERVTQ